MENESVGQEHGRDSSRPGPGLGDRSLSARPITDEEFESLKRGVFTLADLQEEHLEWQLHNFPDQTPHQGLLGVIEEVGELAHAHLKNEQGIRTNEDHKADAIDAIGDIVIYLASYCNTNNISLHDAVYETWEQVRSRDWQKNKETGQ